MGTFRKGAVVGLLVVMTGAMGVALAPVPGLAQEQQRTDTVTVAASREIDVEPDTVRVFFGVRTKGRLAQETLDKLASRSNAVLEALRADGFTDEELETRNVSLRRDCLKRCSDPNPKDDKIPEPVIGYRASSDLVVETNRVDDVGSIIDLAVRAGANRVERVIFDVEDKREAVKVALREAMEFATEKAQILADTGGRTLGPAIIIEEGRTQAPRPQMLALADYESGSTAGSPSSGPPIQVEPPTLSASARVTVTFELQ